MSNFTWLFLAMVSAVVGTVQAVFVYLSVKHDLINNAAIAFSIFSGLVFYVLACICIRRGLTSQREVSAHNRAGGI
jgi:spore maturation protein SpmA